MALMLRKRDCKEKDEQKDIYTERLKDYLYQQKQYITDPFIEAIYTGNIEEIDAILEADACIEWDEELNEAILRSTQKVSEHLLYRMPDIPYYMSLEDILLAENLCFLNAFQEIDEELEYEKANMQEDYNIFEHLQSDAWTALVKRLPQLMERERKIDEEILRPDTERADFYDAFMSCAVTECADDDMIKYLFWEILYTCEQSSHPLVDLWIEEGEHERRDYLPAIRSYINHSSDQGTYISEQLLFNRLEDLVKKARERIGIDLYGQGWPEFLEENQDKDTWRKFLFCFCPVFVQAEVDPFLDKMIATNRFYLLDYAKKKGFITEVNAPVLAEHTTVNVFSEGALPLFFLDEPFEEELSHAIFPG